MNGVLFEEARSGVEVTPNRADIACFIGFVERRSELAPPEVVTWLLEKGWPKLPGDLLQDRRLTTDHASAPGAVRMWLLANGWPDLQLKPSGNSLSVYTALPESVRTWLVNNGWRQEGNDARDDDALFHTPVPIENFESFSKLFIWESRSGSAWATWLGVAVRSFFEQGGARCFVVRAGDSWDFEQRPQDNTRTALLQQLVPSYKETQNDQADRQQEVLANQENWRGIEALYGLDEAAFICLPDVPELFAAAASNPVELTPLTSGPEEFTECSLVVAPPQDQIQQAARPPACTDYGAWFNFANAAATFLYERRKDVELILAVPLPAEGTLPQGDLLSVLNKRNQSGLGLRRDARADKTYGIATAFLQLVYPWLGTPNAEALPGQLEPPDGAFAGVLARTVSSLGVHRSLGGQPLRLVSKFSPPLGARDQQLVTPKGEDPALILRVSLLGDTPTGAAVLSDVTTSLDSAHRPACVGRLTAAILRTAQSLGRELVLEPSGPALWRKIERRLDNLMGQFFHAGTLLGESTDEAYSVRCDETTMTQNDIDNGRVIAIVAFTPAQPVGVITVVLSLRNGAPPVADLQD